MDTNKVVQELIQVRELMEKLDAKEKVLKSQLLEDVEFTGYKGDNYSISKTIRRDVVLKKDIDTEFVLSLFPDVVKQSIDMTKLREKQEAHDLLEIKEIPVLTVKLK